MASKKPRKKPRTAEEIAEAKRRMKAGLRPPWKPGCPPPNPKGRPKGSTKISTALKRLLGVEASRVMTLNGKKVTVSGTNADLIAIKAVEQARQGRAHARDFVADRVEGKAVARYKDESDREDIRRGGLSEIRDRLKGLADRIAKAEKRYRSR